MKWMFWIVPMLELVGRAHGQQTVQIQVQPQVVGHSIHDGQVTPVFLAPRYVTAIRMPEPQERTTWLRIVAFNGIGQACAEHLAKGDCVYVEGRLQVREYEDKDHNERTSVEVVASKVRFLGRGNNNGDDKRPVPGRPQAKREPPSP